MKHLNLFNSNNILLPFLEVRLFSDIHLEFEHTFRIPNLKKNQVVLLAGDIGRQGRTSGSLNKELEAFLLDTLSSGAIVLFVTGNHEYYGSRIDKLNKLLKEFQSNNENFYFLDDESILINEIEFIGGTLWTDFNNQNSLTFLEIGGDKKFLGKTANTTKDYQKIRKKGSLYGKVNYSNLMTKDTYLLHKQTLRYIKSRIGESHTQFVMTHFAPSELFLDKKRWSGEQTNGYDYNISKYAYYSELESIAEEFDYWASGHTHKYVDESKNGVRYLSHPRGYIGEGKEHEVSEFNPNYLIKVYPKGI
jgi:predicted phosphohydrolase